MPTTTRYAYNSPWDGRWRSGAAAFSYAEDDCVRRQGIPLPLSLAKKGTRVQKFAFYVEHCVPQGAKFLIYKENRRESQSKYISMAKEFKFGMKRKRKGEEGRKEPGFPSLDNLIARQQAVRAERPGRIQFNPPTQAGLGGTTTATFVTAQTGFSTNVWANGNNAATRPPETVPTPSAPDLVFLRPVRSSFDEPEREE